MRYEPLNSPVLPDQIVGCLAGPRKEYQPPAVYATAAVFIGASRWIDVRQDAILNVKDAVVCCCMTCFVTFSFKAVLGKCSIGFVELFNCEEVLTGA